MSREWKIGDWLEWAAGRYLVIDVYRTAGSLRVDLINKNKDVAHRMPVGAQFVHLQDCTGWDWQPPKPIEPPPGYRLLVNGDIVHFDDLACANEIWGQVHHLSVGRIYESDKFFDMARKIEPKYRPFANAAEFEPHCDRWIKIKDGDKTISRGTMRQRVDRYDDSFIIAPVAYEYSEAFRRFVFADGTPFGVRVE